MKDCSLCGGTGTVLTDEARAWLSAPGPVQATMVRPPDNERFKPCLVCVAVEEELLKAQQQLDKDLGLLKGDKDG